MTAHSEGWEIGMTVYVLRGHNTRTRYLSKDRITKIGRKWITLASRDRFDAENMMLDGGRYTSNGRIYLHESDYEDELEITKVWRELYSKLSYQPPKNASLLQIVEAFKFLGIELKQPAPELASGKKE